MSKNNFNFGWYMFAMVGGMASGLMFSRAQYHKGQADAYSEISERLQKVHEDVEEYLAEHENKEGEAQ